MSFSNYLEEEILDHIFGGNTAGNVFTPPATLYVALSTATPSDTANTFVEPVGNGYARVSVPNTTSYWEAASAGVKTNAQPITFPAVTTLAWGTIVAVGVYDASSGGNQLAWGVLTASKTANVGDIVQFSTHALSIQMD
jgi:hypothetical protein